MLDFIGSLLGFETQKDIAEDNRESARLQAEKNEALQREFAQHGITWRVEDAKRAGLHPLYAIGGSGASFAPNPIVVGGGDGVAAAGQNVIRSALAALDPETRKLKAAQLRVLESEAEKNFALASAARSEGARLSQGGSASVPIPLIPQSGVGDELDVNFWARGRAEDPAHHVDTVRFKPDDVTSVMGAAPAVTAAGNKPGYSEYRLSNDFKMLLPAGSSMSEAVEALGESPLFALMVIGHNMQHYGPGWGRAFAKQFPGLRSLVETGEELAPALEGIERAWSNQFHRSRMPAAVPEFSETRRPEWYGGRADHGSIRRRWR